MNDSTIDVKKEYQKLFKQGRYIHTLQGIVALLDWDQETHMPEGAAEIRGEQLKIMAGLIHKERVSKKLTKPLGKLIDIKTGQVTATHLTPREQSALKEWRRDLLIDEALPKRFVEEFAKLCSQGILAWRKARKENDFPSFAPLLKKIVSFNRKKADYIGYQKHPYDALCDLYEPGMTSDTVTSIFDQVRKGVIPLLQKIQSAPQVDDKSLYGSYPEEKQLALSRQLLEAMGYPFKQGRLDLSTHPFSSSAHPTDSRVTTRLHPDNIFNCISTVLHEGGHSLYEMGLPIAEYGSPLGQSISMGIHESQSRFWETRIGLSQPFVSFVLPLVKKAFPDNLQGVDAPYCYRAINRVEPSLIRVEADEVTYPLHVILRYELEKALIEGSLAVAELPSAWNEKMKNYLGILPLNDREGCLQDIHWAMGSMGYFPTYALGNLYAAELFSAFQSAHPDWSNRVEQGEFAFIREFLSQNVYRWGREFRGQELIQKITGKPFGPENFLSYLQEKYRAIYHLH
jgi:carboxypeptidase Taq